jgi:hypothetical protein
MPHIYYASSGKQDAWGGELILVLGDDLAILVKEDLAIFVKEGVAPNLDVLLVMGVILCAVIALNLVETSILPIGKWLVN